MGRNSHICTELGTHRPKPCQGSSIPQQPLVVSKNLYSRLVDYTTENERIAVMTEKKTERAAELMKASHQMTKDWDNAIKNVQRQRRKQLLSKKRKTEEARIKFVKDMEAKNTTKHAEIVREAWKLLLYKKPQYRLINSALFTAETYRELHAQLAFKRKLEGIEVKTDNMFAELLKKDTEEFFKKEKLNAQERLKRTQNYRIELKKQIEDTNNHFKKMNLYDTKADEEDLQKMQEEARMSEECEQEQMRKKKESLKKMFLDQLEEKKRMEEKMKEQEKIQNRSIEAYISAREHLREITKKKLKEEQENKIKRSEMLGKKCAVAFTGDEMEEEERIRREVAEKDKLEVEKTQEKRQFHEKMRADIKRYEVEAAAQRLKREQERKNMIDWEIHQRYKREECNKQTELKAAQEEYMRKKEMAAFLKKQMAEQNAIRKMENIMNDDSQEVQKVIQTTNERVLAYGKEVLEESKNVRPLFPIIEAIESFKRENGLLPPKPVEKFGPVKRKPRMKKICSNPIPPEQIFYLG